MLLRSISAGKKVLQLSQNYYFFAKAWTIKNFALSFSFSNIKQKQISISSDNQKKIPYSHLYFDQQVEGIKQISKTASEIKFQVQKAIQQNKSLPHITIQKIVLKIIKLMTEQIAIKAKNIYNNMNMKGKNKSYINTKITSIWEIRKMIQRQILWTWENPQEQEKNSDIIERISKLFSQKYEVYAISILKTIVYQGKTVQQYSFETSSPVQNFLSLGEKILISLKNLFEERCKLQKENLQKIGVEKYFYEGFQARFKPTQNMYWQNNLTTQQARFIQAGLDISQSNNLGIVFIPTYYTYSVFIRVFDMINSLHDLGIDLSNRNKEIKYRYMEGLKFNGKSIAILLARDLGSYIIKLSMITIPNFQSSSYNQLINLLCAVATRDAWRRINIKQMKEVQEIWKKNNYPSQGSDKLIEQNQIDVDKYAKGISRKISILKSETNIDQIENSSLKRQVYDSIINNYSQMQQLNRIIQILNKTLGKGELRIIVIDQFNYFGRLVYQLIDLKNQSSPLKLNLVKIAEQIYFTKKFFVQDQQIRMFASTNNYQYLKLIQFFTNASKNSHHQSNISYLHYGRQMAKKVIEFLNIHVFHQKQNIFKRDLIKKLIQSNILLQALSEVNLAFNLRQCQNIAKGIYKITDNKKILDFQDNQLKKSNEQSRKPLLSSLIDKIKQQMIDPIIQIEQKIVYQRVRNQLLKLIQQRKFDQSETFQLVFKLIKLFNSKNQQYFPLNSDQETMNQLSSLFRQKILTYRSYSIVNQVFHPGYKNLFKKFFETGQIILLIRAAFLQSKKKIPEIQFFIQFSTNFLTFLQKDKDKVRHLEGVYCTLTSLAEIIFQNSFGQYFHQSSKNSTSINLSFKQAELNQNSFKFQIKKKSLQFQKVIYKQISQKNKIFQEITKNKITQKTFYCFRTRHHTPKCDYILVFMYQKNLYYVFTELGLKKYKFFSSTLKDFYIHYNSQLLKLKSSSTIIKYLVISLQNQNQESFQDNKNKQLKDKQFSNQNIDYREKVSEIQRVQSLNQQNESQQDGKFLQKILKSMNQQIKKEKKAKENKEEPLNLQKINKIKQEYNSFCFSLAEELFQQQFIKNQFIKLRTHQDRINERSRLALKEIKKTSK